MTEKAPPTASTESRPRWRRKRYLFPGLLLLLLGAAGAFLLWLVASHSGARWTLERLGGAVPGTLEIGELEGPLRGPLTLRNVRWEKEGGPTVTIERARIEWQLRDLLRRQLDVHSLVASGIDVHLAPSTDEETGLPDVNLRFNVVVREARIEDLTIHPAGEEAEPIRIASMALDTATVGEETVEVTAFDLRSPQLDLDLAGRFTPIGDYPVDLQVEWALRREGWPELRGEGSLEETLTELAIDQRIAAPFDAVARGTLLDPLYDLRFRDLRLRFEGVRPEAFFAEAPAMVAAGDVTLDGAPSDLAARGTVSADTADWGRLHGEVVLAVQDDRLHFEPLVLERPGTSTRARAAGTLTMTTPVAFDARLTWTDLPIPPTEPGEAALTSPRGEASIRGTGESFQLTAAGGLRGSGVPPGQWQLRGRGTDTGLRVERLSGRVLGGTVRGDAEIRWQPALTWTVDVTGEGVDPLALVEGLPEDLAEPGPWAVRASGDRAGMRFRRLEGAALGGRVVARGSLDWEGPMSWTADLEAEGIEPGRLWTPLRGAVRLRASTSGRLLPSGLETSVTVSSLEGTLHDAPIAGTGAVRLQESRWAAEEVELDWGEAAITADGVVGGEEGLSFTIRDLPLERVAEGMSGILARAEGRVLGSPDDPRVVASFEADRVAWQELSTPSLGGSVDLGFDPSDRVEAELVARRPEWNGRQAESLTLAVEGARDDHVLRLLLTGDPLDLRTSARGALLEAGWRGTVTDLTLAHPRAGEWSLTEPARVEAVSGEVDLGRICLIAEDARGCASGRWIADGPLTADLELVSVPLDLAEPFLPTDVRIRGTLDGRASLRTAEDGLLVGEALLEPGPGAVLYSASREDTIRLTFAEGRVAAEAGPAGVEARLDLTVDEGDPVSGRLSLPPIRIGGDLAALPIDGSIEARTDRLAILSAFVPQLTETEGRLEIDLDLAGTLAEPRATGSARLAEGAARVPELGLRLTGIELVLEESGEGPLSVEGRLGSGSGVLRVEGSLPLGFDAERPLRLDLEGDDVLVADTDEARIVASPDLEVVYDGRVVRVTGEVRVPEADLEIERRPPGAITVSDDVVYVNEVPEAVAAPGLDIEARVRLILGDDVEFTGFGVEARLEGTLLLRDAPNRPTMATGEIRAVEGTYEAYGQDLTIERGRLIFAGPVTEPRVSVRAYREARDGTIAGIEASGPLRAPEVSLWSDEPMSQSEQLSYVVLGRPLRAATGTEEEDVLGKAATSLGLAAGGLLAERLREELGIEQLEIDTDRGTAEAELVLGTYLSPRVYIGYGIGLFDAVSTFRIRYLINDKWSLEAQTGRETSGDVLYVIERGGRGLEEPEGEALDSPDSPAELEPVKVPTEDEEPEG